MSAQQSPQENATKNLLNTRIVAIKPTVRNKLQQKNRMTKQASKRQQLDRAYQPFKENQEKLTSFFGCKQIVFGQGDPSSPIIFIGEAPGRDEDEQGKPFVGRSGQLLTRALNKLNIARESVFITNIVKCRPPNNRTPLPQEVALFRDLLLAEIEIIEPKVICTLGSSSLNALFEDTFAITKTRGRHMPFKNTLVIPAYHPAYVLRNPSSGKDFLEDLKSALATSGLIQTE